MDFFTAYREGQLADAYHRVPALLAELEPAELTRAGRLLAQLAVDEDQATVVRVAITGHGTLSPLVPSLTAELARHGLLLRPTVGDFGGYLTELSDPDSAIHRAEAELTLCVLDAEAIFAEVPVPWRPADVRAVFDEKLSFLDKLASVFEANNKGTLVLNTLPLPHRFTAQLVDHRSRAELGALWREANARLLRFGEQHPGVLVIDLEPLLAEGIPVEDPRMTVYAGMHLSAELLARYAREIGHLARGAAGRTKKCLVLDLDGTVWGGILGEDGHDGIEVAESHHGEAFRAFQRVVKQIGSQGVLLAVVSKNDLDPVRRALTENPRMTLGEQDFVRIVANWQPKHDNLRQLAADLNLGVDSFAFVDDSALECGLVRGELPGVAVLPVTGDPALHVGTLLADGWFDVRELTAEDSSRVAKYREDLSRKDFLDSFDSIEQYLAELGVRVRFAPATEAEFPRVSQLTLRTNQFNLTTRRLSQPEVGELAGDPAWHVLAIRSSDRFGENGLVGVVFARRDGSSLHLDNFVLSCRVFSRGIEQACLSALLHHAREHGITEVFGSYRPTAKNGKVADFYPRYGFTTLPDPGDGTTRFRHDLGELVAVPGHVDLDFGGALQ
uniref:Glyceryltransferase/phosphatase n=1 Tax=Amycolatopsis orientalis TaxID=31958 RepID=K4FDK7_AMYOR|nr:glyceryltransferase/phosphatase [Amycolatopsis orientalis]